MASVPTPGDGFVDDVGASKEDNEMSNAPDADLSNDSLELLLEQDMGSHDALMLESRGNALSAHSIVRHSAARKFNQEDPIEAAAAEMILQKTP